MINKEHPKHAELPKEAIMAINKLHVLREGLLLVARSDKKIARTVFPLYKELEATLQKLWGFPINPEYVKEWYYPYCTCPKVDNDERYPYGQYYQTADCPIHGYEKDLMLLETLEKAHDTNTED